MCMCALNTSKLVWREMGRGGASDHQHVLIFIEVYENIHSAIKTLFVALCQFPFVSDWRNGDGAPRQNCGLR